VVANVPFRRETDLPPEQITPGQLEQINGSGGGRAAP
jgi:hypothetical protein